MIKTSPAPEIREKLRPFRTMYRDLVLALEALPDADLEVLATGQKFFGQTNCSWDEYAAINIVAPLARGEISRRSKGGVQR